MEELEVSPLSCLPHTSHPTSGAQGKQAEAVSVLLSGSIHAVNSTCVSEMSGTLQQPQTV